MPPVCFKFLGLLVQPFDGGHGAVFRNPWHTVAHTPAVREMS